MTRQHRHQQVYPALWNVIVGAIRDAVAAHPDIQIPDKRRASITKRAVGAVLALAARAGQPAETSDSVLSTQSDDAQRKSVEGVGQLGTHTQPLEQATDLGVAG